MTIIGQMEDSVSKKKEIVIVKLEKHECIEIRDNTRVFENIGIDSAGNRWKFYFDRTPVTDEDGTEDVMTSPRYGQVKLT